MLFFRRTFSLFALLYLSQSSAQENSSVPDIRSCPIPVYAPIDNRASDAKDNAVTIFSQNSNIIKNQQASFSGGVTLMNNNHAINANELTINRQTESISALGDIHFQNQGINVFASKLMASEQTQETQLLDSAYQLNGNPGHGSAGSIYVNLDGTLKLMDSSFTTCYGEVPDWQIEASEINISAKDNLGEAYHARIKLFDIPVLYIPYISFPVTNERKSGFLYPVVKSSNQSGLIVEVPYYFNIAENMDATVTPRLISKRGLQLLTEFRYLSGQQSGEINLEYLDKDNNLKINQDPRYLARFEHVGTFSERFRAYVDYTTISDDNYLVDLDTEQYNANDAYLYQVGELAYFGETWQAKMQFQDFEVLGDHKASYKTLPHIEIKSTTALPFLNGQFDVYSELTSFKSSDRDIPEAERYHIEAGAIFPLSTPAWFLTSEFKLLQTHYEQKRIPVNSLLEDSVNRTLPKVRLHGGINLERDISLFDGNFLQTLEPQLQYLYVPNKDQSNIGVYDTTVLQDDYSGLFRDKRFSGLDRIAQANQYSWGVTSRILSQSNDELFRLSLGRIVYLNEDNITAGKNVAEDESALASEVFWQFSRKWQFSSDIQYNTKTNTTNKSQSSLDYQYSNNQTIQLNHRYSSNVSGTSLEQVSVLTSYQLNPDWQFVGRVTQDLQNKRSLESYLGLQYESCCWAIRIAYHRHINSKIDEQGFINENRDEFDSGFMLEFVIKGLSGGKARVNTEDMFNASIFGYKRPYFLNN
ncbi:LPS-assembly protein LptD [Thalassotalea profundi]|uniref:LPS-assembly protein LptD n=1 Tax=Thalassotalea profundi TaxID=2036687 RepID=A0ABQ3IT64_9GAMM|nr:LPS assembly protein LptD [Thalassotalea profundi]GHE92094.1 LPS-assembly protein LptD [Thalassotalea profundi]